jgi:hypothetical protein
MTEEQSQMATIDVGVYNWQKQPIPKCDSCGINEATHKVYTKEVGIRLCEKCIGWLKSKLAKIQIGDL